MVGKALSSLVDMIRKCPKCGRYTLKNVCSTCNSNTISPHPPKFSLEKEEKYGKYRRKQRFKLCESKSV